MDYVSWNVLVLVVIQSKYMEASFGLISPYELSKLMLKSRLSESTVRRLDEHVVCNHHLHLSSGFARRECSRTKDVVVTLVEALRLSLKECYEQFLYERWDCDPVAGRLYLLTEAFPETAFLVSLTSASLVHTIARACRTNRLQEMCFCDSSGSVEENRNAWRWGRYGDNTDYAQRFVRQFLLSFHSKKRQRPAPGTIEGRNPKPRRKAKKARDLRALVDEHNVNVGIQTVINLTQRICKCHGFSGSCTVRTCWRRLSTFKEVGTSLKQLFNTAKHIVGNSTRLWNVRRPSLARTTKNRTKTSKSRRKKIGKRRKPLLDDNYNRLVYLGLSPDFCSLPVFKGTTGRECWDQEKCNSICCGGLYDQNTQEVRQTCCCRFQWCCRVKCEENLVNKTTFTCI